MDKQKMRIGIISFEHMHALSYTSALLSFDDVEIVGIFDQDQYRGTEMSTKFVTKYYNNADELLQQKLDGVVICTNNRDHVVYVEKAVRLGIPFIVEKPLANSFENAKKILNLVEEHQVNGMLAFPMRFNPVVVEAKNIIKSGKLGEILSITGINHGKIPSGWFLDKDLSGGGAIIDHTVHIADLVRWFTGVEFERVYASGGELVYHKGIDDTGIILGQMTNSIKVSIDCSWAHHENYPIWPQVDMNIIGSKGSIQINAFDQVLNITDKKDKTVSKDVFQDDGDGLLMRSFVNMCRTGELLEDYPCIQDGFEALKVAFSAYKSVESKNIVNV